MFPEKAQPFAARWWKAGDIATIEMRKLTEEMMIFMAA